MKGNVLKDKSYKFALRVVRLYQFLIDKKKEFVISKQILRSGTSIGAMVREAEFAQSKADFINKMHISLKESNETLFWLELLKDTEYLDTKLSNSLYNDNIELIKILTATVKTSKENK